MLLSAITLEDFQARYHYDQVHDKVGKGGFGSVYRALDRQTGEYVAIKVSPVEDKVHNYSLLEEARRALHFDHPNLVKYYEVFRIFTQMGWFDFAVMEYIPHGHLGESKVPSGQLRPILAGILWGLRYLHQQNIIHRDLKPQNILVDREGDRWIPKITDFGLAKETEQNYTTNTTRFVTPEYMAPEQIDPRQRLGNQVDFWALGVITYQICFGRLPFGARQEGDSEQEIIQRIISHKSPRMLRAMPMPYQAICRSCLEFDPDKRVQSADALLQFLDQAVWELSDEDHQSEDEKSTEGLFANLQLELNAPPEVNIANPLSARRREQKAMIHIPQSEAESSTASENFPPGWKRFLIGGLMAVLLLGLGGGSWLYQRSQKGALQIHQVSAVDDGNTKTGIWADELLDVSLQGFRRDEQWQLLPVRVQVQAVSAPDAKGMVRLQLGMYVGAKGRDQYLECNALVYEADQRILIAPIKHAGRNLIWPPGRMRREEAGRIVWESTTDNLSWLLKSSLP